MTDINKYKRSLHKYMINNKIFGNYVYHGSGSFGHAFKLKDNTLIKVTKCEDEFDAAIFFSINPNKHVVKYVDAHFDEEGKLYILHMECLTKLDIIKDKEIISDITATDAYKYLKDNLSTIIDINELHWENCGYNKKGIIKFFDMKLL